MSKLPMALPLLGLLSLAACGPRVEWVKEGADASQLRQDRDACSHESGSGRYVDDSRAGSEAVRSGGADVYRLCMESRGWHRQRVQDKPTTSK